MRYNYFYWFNHQIYTRFYILFHFECKMTMAAVSTCRVLQKSQKAVCCASKSCQNVLEVQKSQVIIRLAKTV